MKSSIGGTVAPAGAGAAPPPPSDDADDSDYGWAMFTCFVLAVLSISIAVGVLALVRSWWMLGIVMVVDVTITGLMMMVIFRAVGSKSDTDGD